MRKFLFILASTATLAMVGSARAQYLPPTVGGVNPGYNWRQDHAQDDWRKNTWREETARADWRNNTSQEKRAKEGWRYDGREDFAKDRTKNNAKDTTVDRGYDGDCGVGSMRSSTAPCRR